jgi:mannose-6-phosphate isomerase
MSDASLYPYVLDPKLAPAIWGGDELVKTYGKHGDPTAKIGESWECWDTDTVTNGSLRGDSVGTLRGALGPQLLGDLDPNRIFPVLTKIITAHDWLSVQVHPNDAYAQRVEHQPNGKTECWYVFSADEGAELVVGWTRDTSRQEYERRVKDGTLGEILRRIPVKAGDSVYIPSGMVHAIGSGVTLFETQQASDLTYRMFDWNRVGADGKPRELHVQKAADVLNYKATTGGTLEQIQYTFENLKRLALIADKHFVVERVVASNEPATMKTNGRPLIIMSLEHPMHVGCDGVDVALTPYQTALVPAASNECTVCSDDGEAPFMFVTPAEQREQLAVQMLAAGVDQARIDRFMEQFTSPSA